MSNPSKTTIAKYIKDISLEDATKDFLKLKNIDLNKVSSLGRAGLKFIDYFTFIERLDTIGSKGISFFTFIEDFEKYFHRPSIKRLYYQLRQKYPQNFYICAKQIFQLYFGSINAFRPIVAMKIYDRYKPKNVLNVCSGWGAFLAAAAALNIPKITAIDNNPNLLQPYTEMILELKKHSSTDIKFINKNASILDLSNNSYDMIISSPPYYDKEI